MTSRLILIICKRREIRTGKIQWQINAIPLLSALLSTSLFWQFRRAIDIVSSNSNLFTAKCHVTTNQEQTDQTDNDIIHFDVIQNDAGGKNKRAYHAREKKKIRAQNDEFYISRMTNEK